MDLVEISLSDMANHLRICEIGKSLRSLYCDILGGYSGPDFPSNPEILLRGLDAMREQFLDKEAHLSHAINDLLEAGEAITKLERENEELIKEIMSMTLLKDDNKLQYIYNGCRIIYRLEGKVKSSVVLGYKASNQLILENGDDCEIDSVIRIIRRSNE